MNRYILASFLGSIPAETTFEESKWPLHVTLTRAFLSSRSESDLITILGSILTKQKSFVLTGKSEELFGPQCDRPVVELALTTEATGLNTCLKEGFASSIDQHVPDKYPRYRPHVTRQGDDGIAVGDTVKIGSVSIIRANDGEPRQVLATIHLT